MIGEDVIPVQNMIIRPNNTFIYSMQYEENSVLQDTSGYQGFMQFRQYSGAPRIIFQASTPNNMITFDGPTSRVNINIPPETTAQLALLFREGVYDLIIQKTNGIIKTIMQGKVVIDPKAVTLLPAQTLLGSTFLP